MGMSIHKCIAFVWVFVFCAGAVVVGQEPATQPSATTQPTTQPAHQSSIMPDPQRIEFQLLEQLDANPLVAPTQTPFNSTGSSDSMPLSGTMDIDPRVLGVAPGQEMPKLRREGEFIVNRRGRLVQAPNGRHALFVFEADSQKSPETPMVFAPCLMLQNMEDIVRERGGKVIFILSGQVLVYRGINYLLPTMMKLAIDRGNLNL